MRKLEVSLVACLIGIVILATSMLYFHDLSVWQENRNESLKRRIHGLQSEKNALVAQNEDLEDQVDDLNGYNTLLQSEKTKLQREVSDLESQMETLQRVAEENKFEFYYALLTEQRYGVDDLQEYLDRWEWIDGIYVEGVFDCSEMSAYIEWKLENEGYHTVIVIGTAPSDPEGYHAWLLVETSVGHYMPVEATQYDIVYWSDPYFDNYFIYDTEFETIQDALEYSYEEFDWWTS